jgi:hypothetical protein
MARRTLRLVILAACAGAIVVFFRRRSRSSATPSPRSTPFGPTTEPTPASHPTQAEPAAAAPPWLRAVDGECPPGYPVKVNESSGIFHVPGGRFYQRTIPDRCYATSADAEADGYRQAKA